MPGPDADEHRLLAHGRSPRRRQRRLEHLAFHRTAARDSRRRAHRRPHPIEEPKSRSISLSRTLSSVASVRCPMIRPHGKREAPGRELASARARDHHRPRGHRAAVLDGLVAGHVDHGRVAGEHDPCPEHGARAHAHALDHDAPRPDEGAVLDHDRRGLQRLEHPADADAAGEVHVGADLRARADGGPGVDHRVRARPTPRCSRSSASARRPATGTRRSAPWPAAPRAHPRAS